jgi:ketosteroid isomerase-like protein
MSQENVDNFKAGYQAFGSGDLETATKDFSDDVEWWTSPEVPPTEGVIKGKQDLIASWQQIPENWSDFSVVPSDFIDADDKVIVLGTQRATAKEGGQSFESPFVQVAWFEDGKLTRAQFHSDSAAALKALGL